MTVGTFDLFHAGHVNFLRMSRALGDRLVVGVNSDSFVEHYKGKPPVMSFHERTTILSALRMVDEVMGNNTETLIPMLNASGADILTIGTDWAKKDYYAQIGIAQEELDRRNVILAYLPYTEGISSTLIKERL